MSITTSNAPAVGRSVAIREHRMDTGRIVLNAREAGNGPLTIFLHGITAIGAVWDPVVNKVSGSLRAMALDQRGHGKSDKPANAYTANDYALDVIALVETLDCGPAIVVGHSLGARNGVIAATLRPDLIRGVVAVDFTPYIETEVFDLLESRVNGGDRAFYSQREIEEYLQGRYIKLPSDAVNRRAIHGYMRVGDHFRPRADASAMSQTANGLREDLVPAYREVTRPVLMVRGADSKLVSEAALAATRLLRPDMTTLVVDNTDHYVPEEAPEVIAAAVLGFAAGA